MVGAIQTARQYCFGKVQNRRKCIFICTFIWGLIAHAYGMLHSAFVHDGLNAIYIDEIEEQWKVAIGRIFVNIFRSYRGKWELPWLIGIVSLLFVAISAYLLTKIFSIDSVAEIVIASGIMVVNPITRNLVATYIYEMDIDMFALLLSIAAVFFVCIWNGVLNCNQLYLQRELQDKARLSYVTRVLERLEDEKGLATNAKEIAIIGTAHGMRSGVANEYYTLGNDKVYYKYDTFMTYCEYVLDYEIPYCSPEKVYKLGHDASVLVEQITIN